MSYGLFSWVWIQIYAALISKCQLRVDQNNKSTAEVPLWIYLSFTIIVSET